MLASRHPISISHDDHNINTKEIVFLFLEGFALPTQEWYSEFGSFKERKKD